MWEKIEAKLPPPREYRMNPAPGQWYTQELKGIGFGSRYGGHLRKGEYHLELGGPKHNYTSFIFVEYVADVGNVDEGLVLHWGPDMNEVPEESSFPFVWHIKVAGMDLTPDIFPMVERGATLGLTWTEGVMVSGNRSNVWMRIGKKVIDRMTFQKLAQSVYAAVKSWGVVAQSVEQRILVATPEMGGTAVIEPLLEEAKRKWEEQEALIGDIKDEDVDEFYGCTVCQLIAPSHVCICTPERPPYCGFLNYSAMKAFETFEPSGFIFKFPKGECLDRKRGWWTGVDEVAYDRSHGNTRKVYLNSCIHYPTTN